VRTKAKTGQTRSHTVLFMDWMRYFLDRSGIAQCRSQLPFQSQTAGSARLLAVLS